MGRGVGERERIPWQRDRGVGKASWLGGSMDGGMLHLRENEWKELKLGAVFEIAAHSTVEPVSGETMERACAVGTSYGAH